MPFLRQRDLFERVGKSERSRIRRIGKTKMKFPETVGKPRGRPLGVNLRELLTFRCDLD
jgi:hypothetical protein